MNRTKRTAIVLGIAVMMAAIASMGVYRVVSNVSKRAAPVTTVSTVVASHKLALGTRLTADHVRIAEWPVTAPVPKSFTKIEDVVNRGLIATVDENEPLTESKLAPLEAGAGLPPSIPPGMRAISVKVNEVVGVAGFVVPGTRVDVMVTLTDRGRDQDNSLTRIVVSNVQVLTAGTRYDQEKAKEGTPMPSTVVTLLVTPDDGERIALAASEGQLMLALRNPLDTEQVATNGVRVGGLFGQPAAPAPKPAAPRPKAAPVKAEIVPSPQAPPKPSVEAIRGGKRTTGEIIK
jgi:pilus assembly protein CpaB